MTSKNNTDLPPQKSVTHAYSLSAATLTHFVKFVQRRCVDGHARAESDLIEQWNIADTKMRELARTETNIADSIRVDPLPEDVAPLVDRILADPFFVHCFESLPVSFAMVELDKLIVIQEDIALDHAGRIEQRLGPSPDNQALFQVCMPYERTDTTVACIQESGNSVIFQSDSMDLRAYSGVLLAPHIRSQVPSDGPLAGLFALPVGFGPNYLMGIRIGSRIVLNNGYHRAHTLRSMGIKKVPMAIRVISNQSELDFASGQEKSTELYELAESDRPPLLKDFFDPLLSTNLNCFATRRQVRIAIDVQVTRVPA